LRRVRCASDTRFSLASLHLPCRSDWLHSRAPSSDGRTPQLPRKRATRGWRTHDSDVPCATRPRSIQSAYSAPRTYPPATAEAVSSFTLACVRANDATMRRRACSFSTRRSCRDEAREVRRPPAPPTVRASPLRRESSATRRWSCFRCDSCTLSRRHFVDSE